MSFGSFFALSCDPFGTGFDEEERAVSYTARDVIPVERPFQLRVMTYNIKFGGARIDFFFDCHGNRVLMNRKEVLENLSSLATFLSELDPDVVFVQEADVGSKRSAYIDQVQWLLDHTPLNYGLYASQWRSDFVPSDGIGPVDSGNAILSKYPLENGIRIALPLRSDQGGLERYFYLRRNVIVADLDVGDPIRLVGTHLAAYSKDGTKKKQLDIFVDEMRKAPGSVIGAGDLNTLPPGTEVQSDFPDSVCEDEAFVADDYREETDWLEPVYQSFRSAIPLFDYQANNRAHFTHTTDGQGSWNRKLDYIFTNLEVVVGSSKTHQTREGEINVMDLSDHAPVSVQVTLP